MGNWFKWAQAGASVGRWQCTAAAMSFGNDEVMLNALSAIASNVEQSRCTGEKPIV
jgi:hypothetical protein